MSKLSHLSIISLWLAVRHTRRTFRLTDRDSIPCRATHPNPPQHAFTRRPWPEPRKLSPSAELGRVEWERGPPRDTRPSHLPAQPLTSPMRPRPPHTDA